MTMKQDYERRAVECLTKAEAHTHGHGVTAAEQKARKFQLACTEAIGYALLARD